MSVNRKVRKHKTLVQEGVPYAVVYSLFCERCLLAGSIFKRSTSVIIHATTLTYISLRSHFSWSLSQQNDSLSNGFCGFAKSDILYFYREYKMVAMPVRR